MKNKFLSIVAIALLSVAFSACSDDEDIKQILITSNRATGQFFEVDPATGTTKPLFNITYNGETLVDIRSIVYHEAENKYFVGTHAYSDYGDGDQLGYLFSVDPATKEATLINDNDGTDNPDNLEQTYSEWYGIAGLAVDADDSLLAMTYLRGGEGWSIVKFSTDGKFGNSPVSADICCGLGILYNKEEKVATIGNGSNQNDGQVIVESLDVTTGESLTETAITDFQGFPDDFNEISANAWMNIRGMAKDPKNATAKTYAILYNGEEGLQKTYFVEIDLTNESMRYIATLGESYDDQYSVLMYLPSNKL